MHTRRFRPPTILALILCLTSLAATAQESTASGDPVAGKTLFRENCQQCHNPDMKTMMTGPPLGPAEQNWSAYPREDLYAWVHNTQALIAKGQPHAVELWNKYKPTVMTPFPNLSNEDIESILAYVHQQYTKTPVAVVAGGPAAGPAAKKSSNTLLYVVLFVVLAVLAMVLARVISNLNQIAQVQEGKVVTETRTVLQMLTSRGVIGFVIFALVVLGGYTTVTNAIDFGRQQGYSPTQPIKFSHATHAGIQGIDCQYCHDGARRSKHAIIPAANTCMNCHRAVTVGSQYGTAEITKIYASIGFNPNNNSYIPDYTSLPEDSIKSIYTKWIRDQYLTKAGLSEIDHRGEMLVENQWEGIKTSLTNPVKPNIPGPIEWIRIHHLPDYVFFSHQQHVSVGKIACQQCHGKVQEMQVMSQYAPLSMGWCINCHRQTSVQFEGNPYYDAYKKYHEEMASGKRQQVTVEDIGGTECQKCHY